MANLNRSGFLPAQIAKDIIGIAQTESAVMKLAKQIYVPGTGISVPVITADPTAAWVGETDKKPVSNGTVTPKLLTPYKIAVIQTVSKELMRDADALYEELVRRLPNALATAFDNTVIGGTQAPGANFDSLGTCTSVDLSDGVYAGLVSADADVSAHGGILNGFAFAPQGRSILLGALDGNDRPLFINSAAEGAVPMILGAPAVIGKGLYAASNVAGNTVGVAGDWSQAIYGIVEGIQIDVSDQATLDIGTAQSPASINLWQQNMVAIRAEMEIGFRANKDCFNIFIDEVPTV